MNEDKGALYYAKAACDTMMRGFEAAKLPPQGHFHYHQGVFLSGMYRIWKLCRDDRYFQYIKDWVDSVVDAEGNILEYDPGQLDDVQPGILLFPLYSATGDIRYRRALDTLMDVVKHFPRNAVGGFWHKQWYPDQMWLDGLYMGGPICCEYAARFDQKDYFDLAAEQALLMQAHTRDEKSGLWRHAWDCSRKAEWANPETGQAPECWGRSIGWVPVAVLDDLDFIPKEHSAYPALCCLVTELLKALCHYQSDEGRWYQVVDKGGAEGNWLENSCSCLYVAAICKAVRKGLLPAGYLEHAKKGYKAVIGSLEWDGDDLLVGHVCIGTGVGDYQYYCSRPVSVNDLHGVGAFLLMCAEVYKAF